MYPLLGLIGRTAQCANLDEIKAGVACLISILGSHARIEEELLRPAILAWLPPPALNADGTVAPSDHEVIESGLARVLAATEIEDARKLLLGVLAETRLHFRKEETIIFGIATRELTLALQEQLGTEWARRRGTALR